MSAEATNLQHLRAEPTQGATTRPRLYQGTAGTARPRDADPSSGDDNTPTPVSPISRQPMVALGQGDITKSHLRIFPPTFIASLKDKREKGGVEPFLVTSPDAVYKLTVLFLLRAGRGEPEPVCYCYSYF